MTNTPLKGVALGAVEPLRENEFFVSMLTMFSNPLMGILVGIAFTAVLQSAVRC